MTRFEVVSYDVTRETTGYNVSPVVLHTWKVAHHHGKRKMKKLIRRVNRWARNAMARSDKELILVRGV